MSLQSRIKGFIGEALGGFAAKLFLDPAHYHSLNNVTLQTGHGTVQIDHVIASRFGVFVVEAKNYQGWIFGSEQQAEWTQCLPGGRKFRFQNPLRQNYRHIKSLVEFLSLPDQYFHSVVMFWGDSEFKTPMPPNVMSRGYATYIRGKTEILLSDEDVVRIVTALQHGRMSTGLILGMQTRRAHLDSLAKRHGSNTRCPKCGADLVERIVKSGDRAGERFLGCRAYPRCRFTRQVPG